MAYVVRSAERVYPDNRSASAEDVVLGHDAFPLFSRAGGFVSARRKNIWRHKPSFTPEKGFYLCWRVIVPRTISGLDKRGLIGNVQSRWKSVPSCSKLDTVFRPILSQCRREQDVSRPDGGSVRA